MIGSFILAVATSTVCATLLNQGIVQFLDHRRRRETARLSALYAANALERYCEQCAHHLGEKETYISSSGHAGQDWGCLPDLPEYPADIDWKRLGIPFTERMFAFRTGLESVQTMISAYYYEDPPDGGDHHVLEQLSKKGLEAGQLARDIRSEFNLTPVTPGGEYSSERYLRENLHRREEQHRRYLEDQERQRAELSAQAGSEAGTTDLP